MTNEEAIEVFKNDIEICTIQQKQACDMAIKALEQQPCEDCISKQAVLRLVEQYPSIIGSRCVGLMADIKHLPPVTPSYNSVKTELDCISREAVDDYIAKLMSGYLYDEERTRLEEFSAFLWELPSVTPKAEWIPVKWHIKTEEDEYERYPDGVVMIDSPMPEDGQEILITIKAKSGYCWVEKTIACCDDGDGWYTDDGFDWIDDIVAWMPLPQPFVPQESEDEE